MFCSRDLLGDYFTNSQDSFYSNWQNHVEWRELKQNKSGMEKSNGSLEVGRTNLLPRVSEEIYLSNGKGKEGSRIASLKCKNMALRKACGGTLP